MSDFICPLDGCYLDGCPTHDAPLLVSQRYVPGTVPVTDLNPLSVAVGHYIKNMSFPFPVEVSDFKMDMLGPYYTAGIWIKPFVLESIGKYAEYYRRVIYSYIMIPTEDMQVMLADPTSSIFGYLDFKIKNAIKALEINLRAEVKKILQKFPDCQSLGLEPVIFNESLGPKYLMPKPVDVIPYGFSI